jgi:hypothetical protein
LSDEVVGELPIHDPVDRVESEHFASNECTLNLLYEMVVPRQSRILSDASLVRRLAGIHIARLNHHPDDLKGIGNDGALWRPHDINLLAENQHNSAEDEHAQPEEVRGPKPDVALHVRGCEAGERADVDAEVEYHVDTLDSDGRVDDDTLASLGVVADDHAAALVLVGDEGGDVGFDSAGTDADDDNGYGGVRSCR